MLHATLICEAKMGGGKADVESLTLVFLVYSVFCTVLGLRFGSADFPLDVEISIESYITHFSSAAGKLFKFLAKYIIRSKMLSREVFIIQLKENIFPTTVLPISLGP